MDLNKSLGVVYEEAKKNRVNLPKIKQYQADSLIEKCSTAIHEIHRPIYKTRTANQAEVYGAIGTQRVPLQTTFTLESWEYIHETQTSDAAQQFIGRVSSYNSNTYKGRIYLEEIGHPVSFELSKEARGEDVIKLVTTSLSANALRRYTNDDSYIYFLAFLRTSRSGRLKGLLIIEVNNKPI